jgi:two-component system phosphate regulon sensor histidine kinase PhoR
VSSAAEVPLWPEELENALVQYAEQDERGLLIIDSRRQVLFANSVARTQLGWEGAVPSPTLEVIRDVDLSFGIGDALHDCKALQQEVLYPDPDRILRFTVLPIRSTEGYCNYLFVTSEDVTRLRHLETVRRDFVANVSHELRTPLASIHMLVETLQRHDEDPQTVKRFLDRIAVEAEAMNRLVDELLGLSRLESGRLALVPSAIAVDTLYEKVIGRLSLMAAEGQITLTADVQPRLPDVIADAGALEQVLMNLVHNALKFTPEGGAVTLRARRQGPAVEIEVVDTGVGIDPIEAERIFERFYKIDQVRHRGSGTGLGLSIVRHILDLHGTKLSVVSEQGHGSRFTFALPTSDAE